MCAHNCFGSTHEYLVMIFHDICSSLAEDIKLIPDTIICQTRFLFYKNRIRSSNFISVPFWCIAKREIAQADVALKRVLILQRSRNSQSDQNISEAVPGEDNAHSPPK